MASGHTSRSGGSILEADVTFPPMRTYEPKSKLPTIKSVIGMLRYHIGNGGAGRAADMAVREVAKQIVAKWYHETVACLSISTISREVEKLRHIFIDGKRRYSLGDKSQNEKVVKQYKELYDKKGDLFDVFQEDKEKRKLVESEWGICIL